VRVRDTVDGRRTTIDLSDVRLALTLLIATRLPVLAVGALAVTVVGTIPPPTGIGLWRVSTGELANLLARWDTYYYYTIATEGYHWNPDVFAHQNAGFFPLLPLLMRAVTTVTGIPVLIAGLVISLIAFAVAIVVLHRLAVLEIGAQRARWASILLASFPFALFYSAVYAESLFLLATVGAFYAMRRQAHWWMAVCGLAAGLDRPNGFLLALPLLFLALRPREGATAGEHRTRAVLAASAPLAGLALFCGYFQIRFGDPLVYFRAKNAWGAPLLGQPPASDLPRLPGELLIKPLEVILFVVGIVVFATAAMASRDIVRRFGLAYGVLLVVNLVPPVLKQLFVGTGRYAAVTFPLFFWLALRLPQRWLWPVTVAFGTGQAVLAALFFLWHPVT
jgi:hypothetical protein